MPRIKHLGDGQVPPNRRAGILRIFQKAAKVTLVLKALIAFEHTLAEPRDRVGDGKRR